MKTLERTFNQNKIRVVTISKEPWFVVADICKVLGLTNPTESVRNFDKDDLSTTEVIDSMGRKQISKITSEAGLYDLVFKSRKKEAKEFKKWVTHEVLPSIRKTGKYSLPLTLKSKSIDARKMMTDEWNKNGVNKGWEYGKLTIQEYRSLKFKEGLRKKDFDEGQVKALLALEAMEMLNLHYNPVKGFLECKESLKKTSIKVLEVKNKGILK